MSIAIVVTEPAGGRMHAYPGSWSDKDAWDFPKCNADGWRPGAWRPIRFPTNRDYWEYDVIPLRGLVDTAWHARLSPKGISVWLANLDVAFDNDTELKRASRAQLMRPLPALDANTLAVWARDCAERVLPLFESRVRGDERPRQALGALNDFLAGRAGRERLAAASAAAHAASSATPKGKQPSMSAFQAARAFAWPASFTDKLRLEWALELARGSAGCAATAVFSAQRSHGAGYAAEDDERAWQNEHLAGLVGAV